MSAADAAVAAEQSMAARMQDSRDDRRRIDNTGTSAAAGKRLDCTISVMWFDRRLTAG